MSSQDNKKTIKNYKRRDANTRRQLHQFVKAMGEEARGGEVEDILLEKGIAPCVAREWGNEYKRHDVLLKRVMARKYRKETSGYGKKGQAYRRIIKTSVKSGRRLEFHATKGMRVYRIPPVNMAGVVDANTVDFAELVK